MLSLSDVHAEEISLEPSAHIDRLDGVEITSDRRSLLDRFLGDGGKISRRKGDRRCLPTAAPRS